jgi:hypothetical protein
VYALGEKLIARLKSLPWRDEGRCLETGAYVLLVEGSGFNFFWAPKE